MKVCECAGSRCRLSAGDERHGTANGYGNLYCRCEPCRAARSVYQYEQVQKRHQKPVPAHVHGTTNGYGYYGCRCAACTEEWSAVSADRDRRRRRGETDCALGIVAKPKLRREAS